MQWNKIILLACALLTASCVDRFIPETTGYDEVLFIECLVSETHQYHSLKISIAAPVVTEEGDKLTYKPRGVSDAQAWIIDSDAKTYPFSANGIGIYWCQEGFIPVPGKSYKLVVNHDGNTFESDYQQLKSSPPINSISFRQVVEKRSETGEVMDGYRFYVSTHEEGTEPSYYRWTADATFQYTVPYIATHIWTGSKTVTASNKLIRTCWKSKEIAGNYTAKTTGLTENKIIETPLNFESQYGDELSIRYSLNVTQYRISESAMRFWENVDKLINQTGSLYETQPFRIEGNIHCTNDPSFYVTGIFELAGESSMRVFVDKPEAFPVIPVRCLLLVVGTDVPWYRLPAGTWVTEDSPGHFLTATPSCYDCQLRDGTLEKPPFWTDR